jgi:hypothetical protein
LANKTLYVYKNDVIDLNNKSKIALWNPETETPVTEKIWNPTYSFLSEDLKKEFLTNPNVRRPDSWVVVDEFAF